MGGPPETLQRPRVTRRLARAAWRHRLATFFLLLIAATLGMRVVWGWQVQRVLDAQFAEMRARGMPLTEADIALVAPPAERDAFAALELAFGLNNREASAFGDYRFPHYPPYGKRWEDAATASETGNTEVFRLISSVRRMNEPIFRQPPPEQLGVAGWVVAEAAILTAGTSATLNHIRGDHSVAIERLLDALYVNRLMRQEPSQLTQVQAEVKALYLAAAVNAAVVDMKLSDPGVRTQAGELIGALLDDSGEIEHLRVAVGVDRVTIPQSLRYQVPRTRVIQPMADAQTVRMNQQALLADQHLRASHPFDVFRQSGAGQRRTAYPADVTTWLGERENAPDYSRWFEQYSKLQRPENDALFAHVISLAERRTAAVNVAIQLYRADHSGRIPGSLDELVPNYLKAVPADPFSESRKPIRLLIVPRGLPDGRDRPLLYYELRPGGDSVDDFLIDSEPMVGMMYRPDLGRAVDRYYRDVVRWTPRERVIDAIIADEEDVARRERIEAEKEMKEEAERIRRELGEPDPPATAPGVTIPTK